MHAKLLVDTLLKFILQFFLRTHPESVQERLRSTTASENY
jgi:hypothetical protein